MTRPRWWACLLSALAAVLALAVPAAAQAKVPASFFGISAVQPSDRDFERMGEVGLGTYRFAIPWRSTQPTRNGPLNWNGVDAAVRGAVENGMQPLPFIYGTPRFISRSDTKIVPPTGSKRDLRDWREFVKSAADRYGRDGDFWAQNPTLPKKAVKKWVLWNEQNARPFWHPRPNPRKYAKLVKEGERGLTAADPKADVVLGGIFGYPRDNRSIPARRFLRELYRVKGIEKHFDAVNLHPYGPGVGAVRKQVKQARSVMRTAGDGNAKVLIGELGWGSGGPKSNPSVVGRKGQASRIRGALELLVKRRRSWNIIGADVYVWRDFRNETACPWCPKAGMLSVKGKKKPAYGALRRVIRANR